jgi:hypothetical protein
MRRAERNTWREAESGNLDRHSRRGRGQYQAAIVEAERQTDEAREAADEESERSQEAETAEEVQRIVEEEEEEEEERKAFGRSKSKRIRGSLSLTIR